MVRSMEVNLNSNINAVSVRSSTSSKVRQNAVPGDSASFNHSQDLNKALQAAPEIRVGQVERAQQLIGDVNYPPRETIHRIATLLAMHTDSESEDHRTNL